MGRVVILNRNCFVSLKIYVIMLTFGKGIFCEQDISSVFLRTPSRG